jgi:hypothetical protein
LRRYAYNPPSSPISFPGTEARSIRDAMLICCVTLQTTKDAIKFYNGKVEDLGKNLGELEKVIGGKSENVRIVEDGE